MEFEVEVSEPDSPPSFEWLLSFPRERALRPKLDEEEEELDEDEEGGGSVKTELTAWGAPTLAAAAATRRGFR